MDKRELYFINSKDHAWLSRVYKKLKSADIEVALTFIRNNSQLNKSDFELKINRMFIDSATRPKNYKEISELLSCANSSLG